jgi:hypothetical protein
MDFHKFRDLFGNEELYLRRTDLFKETDPQEGLPSDQFVRKARGLEPLLLSDELALNNDQAFSRQVYVSRQPPVRAVLQCQFDDILQCDLNPLFSGNREPLPRLTEHLLGGNLYGWLTWKAGPQSPTVAVAQFTFRNAPTDCGNAALT